MPSRNGKHGTNRSTMRERTGRPTYRLTPALHQQKGLANIYDGIGESGLGLA